MNKFFVPKENISEQIAIIRGEDVKHIYKVLRLKSGDKISINDCEGSEYLGEIESINKESISVILTDELAINNESPIQVYLYQGLPKASKMDLIVQKSVELGIAEVNPIITQRVIAKGEIGEFKKVDRWNKIALEACKQCKRSIIPKIKTPLEFQEFINEIKDMDLIIVPYENENGYGIKKVTSSIDKNSIHKVAIVIGPEGGFEEDEIAVLRENGAYIVTLGPRILRTETAGIVTLSIIMYELSDLGGIEE